MPAFPLDKAQLTGFFLESLLFGVFSVLYGIAGWELLAHISRKRDRARTRRRLFWTSTVMYILAIVHLSLDMYMLIQAVIVEANRELGGAVKYYANIGNPYSIAKDVTYITQTLVGDSFITYRLHIVWNRNWLIVILPVSLLFATAVAGYGACYEEAVSVGIFAGNIKPWITAFFSITLSNNVLATLLIAYRVWAADRNVRKFRSGLGGSQWFVIETIVQSAALYSASLIAFLGVYVHGNFAQYTVLGAIQPLIGIVFTLIILRVTTDRSQAGTSTDKGHSERVTNLQIPANQHEYPLRPVAINVAVSRHHDRASFEQFDNKAAGDLSGDLKTSDAESGASIQA